jgi:hypothetical protein
VFWALPGSADAYAGQSSQEQNRHCADDEKEQCRPAAMQNQHSLSYCLLMKKAKLRPQSRQWRGAGNQSGFGI